MLPDGNSADDGFYDIASLYYDTPDLAFMRSKREGIKFRRKLRIRHYTTAEEAADDNQPVFVEIKQRINRTTQKRRLTLPLHAAYALCDGHLEETIDDATDSLVADEVLFLARSLDLQPTLSGGLSARGLRGFALRAGASCHLRQRLLGSSTRGRPVTARNAARDHTSADLLDGGESQ